MEAQFILMVLQVMTTAFLALFGWMLKELWGLWKEERTAREKLQGDLHDHVLEDARTYLPKDEFVEYREATRATLHEHRSKIFGLEASILNRREG